MKEIREEGDGFGFGLLEVVVDEDGVEAWGIGHFFLGLGQSAFDLFCIVRGAMLNLALQGAVEAAGVHLFVLEELVVRYLPAELVGREEEVLHAVPFVASGRAAGGADAEGQPELGVLLHQVLYDGAFATARRG